MVSAHVIIDKMSGRSKGFGFVEMATKEEAMKAIEMFNGQDMGGRNIVVNEASPWNHALLGVAVSVAVEAVEAVEVADAAASSLSFSSLADFPERGFAFIPCAIMRLL